MKPGEIWQWAGEIWQWAGVYTYLVLRQEERRTAVRLRRRLRRPAVVDRRSSKRVVVEAYRVNRQPGEVWLFSMGQCTFVILVTRVLSKMDVQATLLTDYPAVGWLAGQSRNVLFPEADSRNHWTRLY